jgi:hypothetical protein
MADRASVILTKSVAERFFVDWRKAMGRILDFRGTPGQDKPRRPARVTGILADPPPNTDFQLKVVFPYPMLNFDRHWWWTLDDANQSYVLLPAGADTAVVNRQLAAFSKKYRDPKDKHGQIVEPLADVHYNGDIANYGGTVTLARIRIAYQFFHRPYRQGAGDPNVAATFRRTKNTIVPGRDDGDCYPAGRILSGDGHLGI